jgi:hypothetical protein
MRSFSKDRSTRWTKARARASTQRSLVEIRGLAQEIGIPAVIDAKTVEPFRARQYQARGGVEAIGNGNVTRRLFGDVAPSRESAGPFGQYRALER